VTLRDAWQKESGNWIRFARAPEHDRYYVRLNLPRFLELLPPPGSLTVDVGCGEGRLGRELQRRGHRVVGFDYSEPALRALRHVGNGDVGAVADAGQLPLRDTTADLAIAFMALQDMDHPAAVIAEVSRILIPGGRFCFALLHPFGSSGDFTAGKQSFVIQRPYWEARRHEYFSDRDGIELTFWQMHRPLEVYTSALEDAGLLIEAMREPRPDDGADPELSSVDMMPVFLHVRAMKP
jgi:SAM-dependent methyltransferase